MHVSDTLWACLLELKQACEADPERHRCVVFRDGGFEAADGGGAPPAGDVVIATRPVEADGLEARVLLEDRLWLSARSGVDASLIDALMLYAPACLSPVVFRERPFVIVHMAQSLDGMVCTEVGNSKWIGNEANLTHAHRLRALVDGVMVGGNTIRQDLPRLTVRHVTGHHPARLFLSDSFDEMDKIDCPDDVRTILLRSSDNPIEPCDGCETLYFERHNGTADVPGLLAKLHDAGIGSILVEGGPQTFQSLLAAQSVDWLQLHVAPVVFGSGKRVVDLPRIEAVDEATPLKHPFYTRMGDAIMVTGSL